MTKVRIIFEIYKNLSCFCEKLLTSIYVDTQTDCFTCDEISNVKVVRSIDPLLDKEAVRVVQSMSKWIPGKQDGSAVRVKYTLPITPLGSIQ